MFTASIVSALTKFYTNNYSYLTVEKSEVKGQYIVLSVARRSHEFTFTADIFLIPKPDNSYQIIKSEITYTSNTAKVSLDLIPQEDETLSVENYSSVVDVDTILDEMCVLHLMGGHQPTYIAA